MVYCSFMFRKDQMQSYTDPCTYAMQSDMRQLKEMIASDLANYMCEMMPSLNDCVDWVCDRFALDATDELIDFVADCHDEFFGNWRTCAVAEVAHDFGTAPKIDYLRGVEGISLHKRSTLFIHA